MSAEDIYEEVVNICQNLKRVKTGEKASPEGYNQLVDCIEKLLELALNIGLGGRVPYWVPVLDIGKLDYMIVGEPRRDVSLRRLPEYLYWRYFEIKPVYGYLHENDLKFLTMTVNSESKYLNLKEPIPFPKFGEKLSSDYWNVIASLIWKIAEDSGLPYRFMSLEPDLGAKLKFNVGINYKSSRASITLLRTEVRVEVRIE
ncbi:MAG: hypothetical protein B7O98_09470 [Zestosphaera tikiterensis]|uniref:Uncharacterized protein n=1 Tax=Zestosphaera tikiterensis TaxID=1973259 RepID=A0A2R7Y1B7_9CREN|nr:MAG: hypothetical protein B7O98_09470 [Zestosphaera tikiterensis]